MDRTWCCGLAPWFIQHYHRIGVPSDLDQFPLMSPFTGVPLVIMALSTWRRSSLLALQAASDTHTPRSINMAGQRLDKWKCRQTRHNIKKTVPSLILNPPASQEAIYLPLMIFLMTCTSLQLPVAFVDVPSSANGSLPPSSFEPAV